MRDTTVGWHRFSIQSYIYLPVYRTTGWDEVRLGCTVWARWSKGTGVLWIESVDATEPPYNTLHMTPDIIGRFQDALLEHICEHLF